MLRLAATGRRSDGPRRPRAGNTAKAGGATPTRASTATQPVVLTNTGLTSSYWISGSGGDQRPEAMDELHNGVDRKLGAAVEAMDQRGQAQALDGKSGHSLAGVQLDALATLTTVACLGTNGALRSSSP